MTALKQKRAKELLDQGVTYQDMAALVGISLTTLYRVFPKSEQEDSK